MGYVYLCMRSGKGGRRDFEALEKRRFEAMRLLDEGCNQSATAPLWTCPRIARLIAGQFGVHYHEGHLWKILRTLNWSPQRPAGKARERNEEAIRTWKHKTWPGMEKKPASKAARSSSSAKAD